MTREDIIRMAREAGIVVTGEAVWRLCELVAAAEREKCLQQIEIIVGAEREACAMEAEYEAARWPYAPECREPCEDIAKTIRARGEK